MASRLDRIGRLDTKHLTPSGAVRIPANLTRTGVFVYRSPDGGVVRELRHPDDVFKVDSQDTLASAAVTIGHPGMVSPENWRALSVGSVYGVRRDGRFVRAELMVHDPAAIKEIDAGNLQELSCGYDCTVIPESGEYNGEKYDARQTEIRYNHVGLGPKGWGRAGGEVSLKFDGVEIEAIEGPYTSIMDQETKARLDAMTSEIAKGAGDLARANAALQEATAKLEKANARADSLESEVATLKAAADPKRIDGLVSARLALHKTAVSILGADAKLDGKTDAEIMIEAIKARDPKFDASGRSEEYLRARFDFEAEKRTDSNTALADLARAAGPAPAMAPKTDNADEGRLEKALAKHREDAANAWRPENSTSPFKKKAV